MGREPQAMSRSLSTQLKMLGLPAGVEGKRVTGHEKVHFICHSSPPSIIWEVTTVVESHGPSPKPADQRMRRNGLKGRVMCLGNRGHRITVGQKAELWATRVEACDFGVGLGGRVGWLHTPPLPL